MEKNRGGILAATALWSVAVLLAVDLVRNLPSDPLRDTKWRAARIMTDGSSALRDERARLGYAIDEKADPLRTGLIGPEYTDLTTSLGNLAAKRTSTNPAFAAVIVEMLDAAGVRTGDAVAVNFSGSFPALNLAALAAIEAMNLQAVIISSVGASSHGANEPLWTWLDMERILREKRIIARSRQTVAASLGGIVDESGGLDGTGLELGREAIRRNGVPLIDEGGRATLARDIERRLTAFEMGTGRRPAAFINVGGALVSLGASPSARPFPPGLSMAKPPASRDPQRGLLMRMAENGVPVIHLLNVRQLAARYGLPFDPHAMPAITGASIMKPQRFARGIAAGGLVLIGVALVRADLRMRRRAAGGRNVEKADHSL